MITAAGTTSFTYDKAGNLTKTTHPNGTTENQTWDRAGQLATLTTKKGSSTLVSHTITRDAVNNPTQIAVTRRSTSGTRSYLYDPNDRVKAVCYVALTSCTTTNATQAWTYDKDGNRATEKNGTGTGTTTTYTYDDADQLTSRKIGTATPTGLTYDADGNLLTDGTTTYTYDLNNRTTTSKVGTATTTRQRDAEGNLLKQTTGATTTYDWDLNHPVPQLATATAGSSTTSYHYDPAGRAASLTNGTTTETIGHDLLGSPVDLVSTAGAIVRSYDYTPYGTARTATGAPTPTGPTSTLQFAGMLTGDATTYTTRDRTYDPANGRWTPTDPITAPPGTPFDTAYAYVGDQPTRYVDPLGDCNINPFSSSASTCQFWNDVAGAMTGDGIVGDVTTGIVNFGRGASLGQTDDVADLISEGASCTVTHKGLIARSSQVAGFLAMAIASGGGGADANVTRSGAVWDDVLATGEVVAGTGGLPKSFELVAGDTKVWVHGRVADKLIDAARAAAKRGHSPEMVGLGTQQRLRSLQAAIVEATKDGVALSRRMTVGGWELEFRQRAGDALPVLMHGRQVG